MKNIIKSVSLLGLLVFFSCSNNTSSPTQTTQPSTTDVDDGLSFSASADGANVRMLLADNYLETVWKGNPYAVTPMTTFTGPTFYPIKVQVKITDFSYYSEPVDIVCSKDNAANYIYARLFGTKADSSAVEYHLGSDGSFYSSTTNPVEIQGPEDEIEQLHIFGFTVPGFDASYTFFCQGSDGNDYDVTFYGEYDCAHNYTIGAVFKMQERSFTGVISVKLHNYYDAPIYLYLHD